MTPPLTTDTTTDGPTPSSPTAGTPTAGTASSSTSADAISPAHQRNILIAMCAALMGVIASVSGLNVAQQQLALDFGASQGDILWIINSYTLTLAALLLPIGAIGDRWGRKPVLLLGLGLFAASSLGAALATSTAMMIAARIGAGAGAAMIMPVTLSVITSTFPPESRGQAIGIWAGVAGSGGIIGIFVSSFMVDVFTWRWLFSLPIILVAIAAIMTLRHVPNSREQSTHPFDLVGSILSAIAIGGLVLAVHEGPEQGWTATITLVSFIAGVLATIGFVIWERKQAEPLLDLSVFKNRNLASGSFTLVIVFGVMFGIFLVLFPFFQAVLGWSALRSAVGLLPMAGAMMPTSTVAPKVAQRFGTRTTMITGVSIFGAGLATLALSASVEGGYMSVVPGLIAIGLGMGLSMTPATEAITETLPAEKQGVASALNDTSREIGGALGVAMLGSIVTAGYKDAIAPALVDLAPELAEPASEGIGGAFAAAAQAGDQGPALIEAAKYAFVEGWVQSMWVGVAMAAVALAYLIVRGPLPVTTTADSTAQDS